MTNHELRLEIWKRAILSSAKFSVEDVVNRWIKF